MKKIQAFLFENTKTVQVVIVLMHLAGIFGLSIDFSAAIFKQLVPFNLVTTTILLLFYHEKWNKQFIITALFVFLFGFFSEVIGVTTGKIFGNYYYGLTLGTKLFNVPLTIGLNWFLLIYCFSHIINKFSKNHLLINSFYCALFMVFLDFLIEPVAIKFDFWQWKSNLIPTQNYFGWFLISLFLSIVFIQFNPNIKNRIALNILVLQIIFFASLNIFKYI